MAATKAKHTIGKKKTSIARIWAKPGKGKITINKRDIDTYYLRETSKMIIRQPLELTNNMGAWDFNVNVRGGGLHGQAGAIRHAISKLLAAESPENRAVLKAKGLITRDARKKERKLYGQKGARARFQFSKR